MQHDGHCILMHFGAQPELVRLQSVVQSILPSGSTLSDPASFHITLAYGTGEGDAQIVSDYLADWDNESFAVVVDGVGVFDTEDGYVVHLTVRNRGRLTDAQAMSFFFMDMGGFVLSPHSIPTDYHPHITLAYSPEPIQPFLFAPIALIPDRIDFTRPDESVATSLALKERGMSQKAGRVIAGRNVVRLRAIMAALQQIINDAKLNPEDIVPPEDTEVSTGKAFILKRAADGRRLLGMASSNPYKDRDKEFVSEQALRDAIDAEWKGGEYVGSAPVLFWHRGDPIADILWADIESGFLIEIAKERDTPWAKAVFDMIERLDIEWGVSIGFKARRIDKILRVFKAITRKETSVLPLQFAANPFTYAEVKTNMSTIRSMFLRRNAPEAAALEGKLRQGVKDAAKQLDAEGAEKKERKGAAAAAVTVIPPETLDDEDTDELDAVEAKALDVETTVSDLVSMITDLCGDQTPADVADRVMAIFAANSSEDGMDAPESEDAAAPEGEAGANVMAECAPTPNAQRKQTELLDQLVDDLAVLGELDTRLKSLEPLANLPGAIRKFEKRLSLIEKRLSGGPRAASQAEETEVDEDDELYDGVEEKQVDERLNTMLPGLFKKA